MRRGNSCTVVTKIFYLEFSLTNTIRLANPTQSKQPGLFLQMREQLVFILARALFLKKSPYLRQFLRFQPFLVNARKQRKTLSNDGLQVSLTPATSARVREFRTLAP